MADLFDPHDIFFKTVFSHLDIMEDALVNNVPQLAKLISPQTLEKVSFEFENPKIEAGSSNLLLKMKLKTEAESQYAYILLRLMNHPEKYVALTLLDLFIQIWNNEDHETLLPFIYPLVIYHGKPPWDAPRNLASLIDVPEGLEEYVPRFHYDLLDLSALRDEQIQGNLVTRTSLLTLKHIYDDDFAQRFPNLFDSLRDIEVNAKLLDWVSNLLRYMKDTSNQISREDIQREIQRVLPGQEDTILPTLGRFNPVSTE